MSTKITFLGSGSAFVLAEENYQTNIVIEDTGDTPCKCLVDAGTTIPDALAKANIKPTDIDKLFITHNHADHTGGAEYLGFKTFFSTFPFGQKKINLIAHHSVLEELWDNNLKAGMRSLQGQTASLETYFNVDYLKDSSNFMVGDIKCEIVQTIHVMDDRRFMPSYGIMINSGTQKIFFTGDTQLAPNQMSTFYQQADVIFHDCECKKYPNSVHAQYHELCTLPSEIKSKMWLYHYTTENDTISLPDAVADGFKGFVNRGDVFNF